MAGKKKTRRSAGKPPPTDPFVKWRLSNGMPVNGPPIMPNSSMGTSDFQGNGDSEGPGPALKPGRFVDILKTSREGVTSAFANVLQVGSPPPSGTHGPLLGWNPSPPLNPTGPVAIDEVLLEISPGTAGSVNVDMTHYYKDNNGASAGLGHWSTTIP